MSIRNLDELAKLLPKGGRLMGLDVGAKTIGVAISDSARIVATSLEVIARTKFGADMRALARLMEGRDVAGFIIGFPLNMDGTEGPQAKFVREFAQNMTGCADILGQKPEIALWDERLSTRAVERFMVEEADTTRKRRAEKVDRLAATWILQGALDFLSRS